MKVCTPIHKQARSVSGVGADIQDNMQSFGPKAYEISYESAACSSMLITLLSATCGIAFRI